MKRFKITRCRRRRKRPRYTALPTTIRREYRPLLAERLEARLALTTVIGVSPAANTHTAPVSTDVSVEFDQNINAGTATPQTFVVHSMQRGQLVGPAATVSTDGATVTHDPTSDFSPGELVQATLTSAIRSTTGQPADPRVWKFRAAVGGGSGMFSDSGQILGNHDSRGAALGDLDGDGDLDALVLRSSSYFGQGGQRVWLNNGGLFNDTGQSLGQHSAQAVSLGDLDGDGDLDAFVAKWGEGNQVWLNNGAGLLSDSGQSLGLFASPIDGQPGNFSRQLKLGDLDGDGDLDAFVLNVVPSNSQGHKGNLVWLNNGNGGFTHIEQDLGSLDNLGNGSTGDLALGDLDHDGDLDVFTVNVGINRVWLNNGSGLFNDSGQILGTRCSRGISLGDLDGDDDLDAFVVNSCSQGSRVWLNDGGVFSDSGQSLGNHFSWDIELGDLDGDGDLDAFVANREQANRVWINSDGGTFSAGGQSLGNHESWHVSLGDIDNDGDLDALVANRLEDNRVWLNKNAVLDTDNVSQAEGSGVGTTDFVFTVTRLGDTSGTASANWATAAGTATAGSDYVTASGTLNFASGVTEQTITVTVNRDDVEEVDEDFFVNLSGAVGAEIAAEQITGLILNDETTISIGNVTLPEDDDSGVFRDAFIPTGVLDRAAGMTFGPDGNFYVANFRANEILRFDGGSGAFLDTFVPQQNGGLYAPALTGLHFGPDGNLYVPGRDTHSVLRYNGVTGAFIDEFVTPGSGGLASPKGQVFGPDGNLYVTSSATDEVLRYDGSRGEFMNAFVTAGAGGLDNPAGMTFGPDGNLYVGGQSTDSIFRYHGTTGAFIDVFIPALSGGLDAPGGLLFGPSGRLYVVSRASDQVLRYDGSTGAFLDVFANGGSDGFSQPIDLAFGPDGNLYVSDEFEIDRYGSGLAEFTVSLTTSVAQQVTVDFATAGGTATAESDYTATSGTLAIAPGATTATIVVPIILDAEIEADETFFVNLTNPSAGAAITDGQGQGTILNSDAAAFVSIDDVTIAEGDSGTSSAIFNVTLAQAIAETVTVNYSTADGTATAGSDYTATNGTLPIAPGETTATIVVPILLDTEIEANETFFVNLTNPSAGTAIIDGQGQGTILDNDAAAFVSIDDVSIAEGDSGTSSAIFNVTLAPAIPVTVTVNYSTANGTAIAGSDYQATSGQLTFAPNQTQQTITILVIGDLNVEGDETFFVNLSDATIVSIADGQGMGTIRDDDAPAVASVTPLANSHDAPLSTDVVVTFDRNINPATADSQTLAVHSMQRGQLVASAAIVTTADRTVTLDPTVDFLPGELVQATVTSAIQNTAGEAVEPRVWQLRTGVPLGSGVFRESEQPFGDGSGYFSKLALGDLDSDGDLDAFVVASRPDNANRVWLNNGDQFTDSELRLGDHDSMGISLGDLDGDGDLDAFVTNRSQGNRVWINTSGPYSGNLFTDSGQSLGDHFSLHSSLGDVDGDGDLDAFVSNYDYQSNRVWLNDGAGVFTGNGQSLGAYSSGSSSLGDFDGDGDLDAFVTNGDQGNRVWLNIAGSFTDSGQTVGHHNSRDASLGDVDGDGDLDAFVANSYQGNRVWLNDAGSFSDSGQILGDHDSRGIELGDLDGDGDLDAFVANNYDGDRIWLNDAGVFTDGQSLGNHYSFGVALGDVDHDGDLDAVVANYNQDRVWLNQNPTFSASPTRQTLAESNNETTQFSFVVTRQFDTRGEASVDYEFLPSGDNPASADDFLPAVLPAGTLTFEDGVRSVPVAIQVSGDTNTELDETFRLVLSNPIGRNAVIGRAAAEAIIRNDDNVDLGDLPAPFATLLSENGPAHIAVGPTLGSARDTEGDGQPSAAADGDENAGDSDEDGVTIGSRLVAGQTAAEISVTVSGDAKLDAWIDFNGDHSLGGAGEQILTSHAVTAGTQVLTFSIPAHVTAGETFGRFRLSTAGGLAPTGGAADGEVEDYKLTIHSAAGSGVFTDSGQVLAPQDSADVVLGDLDGDGDLDAFVSNRQQSNSVWVNDGGVFSESGQLLGNHDSVDAALGDLDGDGDLDAFVANQGQEANRIWFNEQGVLTDSGQTLGNHDSSGVTLGDLDGDGDLDAFVANSSGEPNRVWLNDGGVFSDSGQRLGREFSNEVALADLDGDGDLDAFVVVGGGGNRVWLNDQGTFDDSGQSLGDHRSAEVALGDLDGDGDLDAFVANYGQANRIWLNEGGQFTEDGQLGDHYSREVALGDLDGDGDLDAFVANYYTNRVWLNDQGEFTESGQVLGDHVGFSVSLGDLDNDGDLDAFVANYYENRVWTNRNATLQVVEMTPTSSGFEVEFSQDLDSSVLNLFDTQTAGFGPSDVTLIGERSGAVVGSLLLDSTSRRVTFIKTGSPLAADTYTVTLRSGDNGIRSLGGALLDGDADGTSGGDFTQTFTVQTLATNAVTVSIPDFVRGPGQDVNLPADATNGIPIVLSETDGVKAVDLRISYDPNLLEITGATTADGLPGGASVVLNNSMPGLAILVFFIPVALPAGEHEIIQLQARVPTSAATETRLPVNLLNVHTVTISDGTDNEFPVVVDDALHVNAFFGDVSGNGRINASDAARVASVAALLDSGFAAFPGVDPIILGDISGNGRINAADASLLARFAALIPVPEIPSIPSGVAVATQARLEPSTIVVPLRQGERASAFQPDARVQEDRRGTETATKPDTRVQDAPPSANVDGWRCRVDAAWANWGRVRQGRTLEDVAADFEDTINELLTLSIHDAARRS